VIKISLLESLEDVSH